MSLLSFYFFTWIRQMVDLKCLSLHRWAPLQLKRRSRLVKVGLKPDRCPNLMRKNKKVPPCWWGDGENFENLVCVAQVQPSFYSDS